ncbi:FtsX-like permease family protein [Mucilaginibacter terrigena]|uniref:FtsX-like permease family protein n=1 Tax=Mucilaginibacter terrigena TaxID=2492395 RepID=A0A4Q5LSQ7_9SPHI|nr:ABC transporter permease [Mucilaginibacter terrigena]RYU92429.1 FtsX-like permease family protein [Mucilaginibacter terrigena]
MFKNYIKTAFRSLKKNKGFTIINVFGLALGLCVCMLIVFYVIDELGYDKFNTKADRIYRANDEIRFGGNTNSYAVSPAPMAQTFLNDFPEVELAVRFRDRGSFKVRKGDENVQEQHVLYADPQIFDVFTLPMLHGDPKTALKNPRSVVINETTAKKYFDTDDAVGKSLTLNDTLFYKVTGVIKDMPKQSHFNTDIFICMTDLAESKEDAWLSNNFNTYILLKPGADVNKLNAKLKGMVSKYVGGQLQAAVHMSYEDLEKGGSYFRVNLIPLKDIHLKSNREAELSGNGNIQYVYMFSAIAIFILLIACVNFMNLSTARSSNRAREVGVRKVLGSPRKYLIAQFLSESVMVTLFATIISVIGAWLLLPLFNQLADKQLGFTAATFAWLLPALLVTVLVIGCLAGSYPAFFLSAFQPVDVLKGKLSSGFKGGFLRSFLVVFQFSISIFLIIGTLVIYHQLKFIQSKDLGFNREQVMVINNANALGDRAKVLKEQLGQLPGVVSTTMTGYIPTSGWRNSTTFFQDANRDTKTALSTQVWDIDEDYIGTMGMKLLQGRNFSKGNKADSTALVINEAAVKRLGVKDPINKELYYSMDNMAKNLKIYRIIGVVKDFNFNSLRENVTPVVFALQENRGSLAVRINTANTTGLIAQVKAKWHSVSPNQQLDYTFMDEDFERSYRTEQRMGGIFVAFTTMAIVIACLGLFGLAAYAAEQRTKEIGIRKVLGANVSIIVGMLSKDFIKLVLIAIVLASPLAWLAGRYWLQGFAYRDGIKWWIIAAAGTGAIVIAFITISFQSVKAALANPVKSLKSE